MRRRGGPRERDRSPITDSTVTHTYSTSSSYGQHYTHGGSSGALSHSLSPHSHLGDSGSLATSGSTELFARGRGGLLMTGVVNAQGEG